MNLEGPIERSRISRDGLIGRELINRKTIENRRGESFGFRFVRGTKYSVIRGRGRNYPLFDETKGPSKVCPSKGSILAAPETKQDRVRNVGQFNIRGRKEGAKGRRKKKEGKTAWSEPCKGENA